MKIKVTDRIGRVVTIDNTGEVEGQVKVEGDEVFARNLDRYFNGAPVTAEKTSPARTGRKEVSYKVNRASDMFLLEFIETVCPAVEHTVEVLEG